MVRDDEAKTKTRRRLSWQDYSYWELFIRPELQREFDEMLASRPVLPSRIFIALTTLLLLGVVFLGLFLE